MFLATHSPCERAVGMKGGYRLKRKCDNDTLITGAPSFMHVCMERFDSKLLASQASLPGKRRSEGIVSVRTLHSDQHEIQNITHLHNFWLNTHSNLNFSATLNLLSKSCNSKLRKSHLRKHITVVGRTVRHTNYLPTDQNYIWIYIIVIVTVTCSNKIFLGVLGFGGL